MKDKDTYNCRAYGYDSEAAVHLLVVVFMSVSWQSYDVHNMYYIIFDSVIFNSIQC